MPSIALIALYFSTMLCWYDRNDDGKWKHACVNLVTGETTEEYDDTVQEETPSEYYERYLKPH